MLTAWAKKMLVIQRNDTMGFPAVSISDSSDAFIPAKMSNGDNRYINTYIRNKQFTGINSALISTGTTASSGVAFGSDDTPPSENDYILGNQITGFSATTPSPVTIFDADSNKYIAALNYTVTNNNADAITIREVGLFVRMRAALAQGGKPGTSASYEYSVMLDRTILSTPVTIPSGESKVVRYEFAY